MIETDCFKELNQFGPDNSPTPDLIEDPPPTPPKDGFFRRLFKKKQKVKNWGRGKNLQLHMLKLCSIKGGPVTVFQGNPAGGFVLE